MLIFTLTYDGPLPADRESNPRAAEKNKIRKQVHDQLVKLWECTPWLANYAKQQYFPEVALDEKKGQILLPAESKLWHRPWWQLPFGGFRFVPLVTRFNGFRCSAEITLLRPGRPGGRLRSGDLDNRIKTLFDCLRMPRTKRELDGLKKHLAKGERLYCVVEDDSLISSFAVESDNLLAPAPEGDVRLNAKITISEAF
jgi:hypothetical protein